MTKHNHQNLTQIQQISWFKESSGSFLELGLGQVVSSGSLRHQNLWQEMEKVLGEEEDDDEGRVLEMIRARPVRIKMPSAVFPLEQEGSGGIL